MTESTRTRTQPTTHTFVVPGATLTYDVRSNDASTEPVLVLIACPSSNAADLSSIAVPPFISRA